MPISCETELSLKPTVLLRKAPIVMPIAIYCSFILLPPESLCQSHRNSSFIQSHVPYNRQILHRILIPISSVG